jgi:hypothetical protein
MTCTKHPWCSAIHGDGSVLHHYQWSPGGPRQKRLSVRLQPFGTNDGGAAFVSIAGQRVVNGSVRAGERALIHAILNVDEMVGLATAISDVELFARDEYELFQMRAQAVDLDTVGAL